MRAKLFSALVLGTVLLPILGFAAEFKIGEFQAFSLFGKPEISDDTSYVSFTGDFGFSNQLPSKASMEKYLAWESSLLRNFQLRVINLEFMLAGSSGPKGVQEEIDAASIKMLARAGYDVVSRANNHSLDFGIEGIQYNSAKLKAAGFRMIGNREFPFYNWGKEDFQIAIFALTEETDKSDPGKMVLTLDSKDLSFIHKATLKANFRIAFVHLGSMNVYPSPHERTQIKRLVTEAGADLIICTGNHFIKGFMIEHGKPVLYGLGNHIFSYFDSSNSEPVGMHAVAGFKQGKLVQLFVVPFRNRIMDGDTGPLDASAFTLFKRTFLERSLSDSGKYFSDPSSLEKLKHQMRNFKMSDLNEVRLRHFLYGPLILAYHFPFFAVVTVVFLITGIGFFVRLLISGTRNKRRLGV